MGPPLRVVVVGAGMAGPAAAIGFARNGHDVTIVERSTLKSESGYAFALSPNCDKCLKHIGIDAAAGGAVPINTGIMMNAEGKVVRERHERAEAESKGSSVTTVFAYRPAIHKQLMEAAREAGVKLRLGVRVVDVDVAKTTIKLEDGEQISADLIIGADGVQSVVRPYVIENSEQFPLVPSGQNLFRFMVSASALQNDPVTSSLFEGDRNMFSWADDSKQNRIILYPVDFGRLFNVACIHPESLTNKPSGGEEGTTSASTLAAHDQKASVETALGIYKHFEPRVTRLLELADPADFKIWKMADMGDVPRWSANRTTMVGDACHPVLPGSFSGASMGIEDALTLSTLLPAGVETADIPRRLQLYEALRRPRVNRVREQGRSTAKGMDTNQNTFDYRQFLFWHDAVQYAQEVLERGGVDE